MKNKNTVYLLIVLLVTLIGLWAIPELIKTATFSRPQYPFGYFSSVHQKFFFRELDKKAENKLHDDEGTAYSDKEFDAALPLLNYRNLTLNGEMPDSVDGVKIEPQLLRTKMVNFRYTPRYKNTPEIPLYIMYESLPKKGSLESPGDLFRLKDRIEFIDAETNTLKTEKSKQFEDALTKAGFVFPSQWNVGDLNIRKPYDEGYFSLDAQGRLFHIKMVNGRPFVRNTRLDPQIEPVFFSMVEPSDKRFYGIFFDQKGYCYLLEEEYHPLRLDIDPVDLEKDDVSILGNFLYWTVFIQKEDGRHYYALKTETLEKVRYSFVEAPDNKWDAVAGKLFPFYLNFQKSGSDYIAPQLYFTTFTAWITNILLALLFVFISPKRPVRMKIFSGVYVVIFGIAGAVALLLQCRMEK